jgi:protein TonB
VPAYAERRRTTRPRERVIALAAVVLVQTALGIALLTGLRVPVIRSTDVVERLIEIAIPPPEPPPPPPPQIEHKTEHRTSSAPRTEPKPLGGSPGPQPAHAPPSVTPIVAVHPMAAASGGGSGTGPALGGGAGGGVGGQGFGGGGVGRDLELIAGDITPKDYPRHLAKAGIGGTVEMRGTVGVNGRVTHCIVTRSSGVPELDLLTCRLIEQRFVYRPATDRYGRPVPDEVEIDWTWD